MKGNRIQIKNEKLPTKEVIRNERGFEIRFNFTKIKGTSDKSASFNYDYIKVINLNKKAIKTALIRDAYPDINDEIALINNRETGIQKDIDAYKTYQDVRTQANSIVQIVLQ